jgi:PAS domain S-box-containing protein
VRFLNVNDAFVRAFGFEAQQVVGQRAADLGLWADEAALAKFEDELTRTGGVRAFGARLNAKDGSEVDCLVSAELVGIGGQPFALGVFHDVTERKRSEEELVKAIEAVMADGSWFSRGVVEKLAALRTLPRPGHSLPQAAGLADLSAREREVLGLVCRGLSDAEIAGELKVARNTVRNHLAALYRKLGVNRRSAVVVWARERGIGRDGAPPPKRTRQPRRKLVQKDQRA